MNFKLSSYIFPVLRGPDEEEDSGCHLDLTDDPKEEAYM